MCSVWFLIYRFGSCPFVVTHCFHCYSIMIIITRIWNDLNSFWKCCSFYERRSTCWLYTCCSLLWTTVPKTLLAHSLLYAISYTTICVPNDTLFPIVRYFWIVHFKGNRVPFGTQNIQCWAEECLCYMTGFMYHFCRSHHEELKLRCTWNLHCYSDWLYSSDQPNVNRYTTQLAIEQISEWALHFEYDCFLIVSCWILLPCTNVSKSGTKNGSKCAVVMLNSGWCCIKSICL